MSKENVIRIPLFNKEELSCVGYREGCGYHTKVFWGDIELASRPNLADALKNAYCGVRAYNFRFDTWLTPKLRAKVCGRLEEAIFLICGTPEISSFTPLVEGVARHIQVDDDGFYTIETKIETWRPLRWGSNLEDDAITATLKFQNKKCENIRVTITRKAFCFDYAEIFSAFCQHMDE